jgi:hypothetical protein
VSTFSVYAATWVQGWYEKLGTPFVCRYLLFVFPPPPLAFTRLRVFKPGYFSACTRAVAWYVIRITGIRASPCTR